MEYTERPRASAQASRNQQPGLPVPERSTPPASSQSPVAEAGARARQGNTLAATELALASTVPRYVSDAPEAVKPPEGWQPEPTTLSKSEAEGEAPKQAKPAILSPQQTQPQASDKPDRERLAAPETRAANTPRPAESAVTPAPRPEVITHSRATAAESRETQAAGRQETDSARATECIVEMASLQKKLDANRMNVLLHDERLGRVVVRLTERAGLVDAMVRADTTRAREVIAEHLPSLMESLGRRGLQAFASLGGQDSGRDEAYRQQGGRSRHPRQFFRRGRRAQANPSVFRIQTES